MRIEWLGHAAMRIEDNGISVVFDPYQDGSVPGLQNISEEANLVFMSHSHYDHDGIDKINIIDADTSSIKVSHIDSFHDDKEGALRGPNRIYILLLENGLKVVHMGDIGCELTESQYAELSNADVLFMPVGGFFTVAPELAADIVKKINPRIVIPMHYRSDEDPKFGYDAISTNDEFLSSIVPDYSVKYLYDYKFDFDKSSDLKNEVIVMVPKLILK